MQSANMMLRKLNFRLRHFKIAMSPVEAAALTAAQQPQLRRADDRGPATTWRSRCTQRTGAENLPLGAGGAPWQQGEWLVVSAAAAERGRQLAAERDLPVLLIPPPEIIRARAN